MLTAAAVAGAVDLGRRTPRAEWMLTRVHLSMPDGHLLLLFLLTFGISDTLHGPVFSLCNRSDSIFVF